MTKYNNELTKSFDLDFEFSKNPINRLKIQTNISKEDNPEKTIDLDNLKFEINSIKDCKLKEKAKNIIMGYGNLNSPLMIIREAPVLEKEENKKISKDNSQFLLKKMFKAINIEIENTYCAYVINYELPKDKKPMPEEIKRYSFFIKKHISIINPKIIVLMGSTPMQALMGITNKISSERGRWNEMIIKNISYKVMITFSPSYLIRKPENKKYSWEDLKKIEIRIKNLNLNI